MKKETWFEKYNISLKLLASMLMSQLFPMYVCWGLLVSIIIIEIVKNKGMIYHKKIPGEKLILLMFVIGCCGSVISAFNYTVQLWPILRDIIRMSMMLLYWAVIGQIGRSCKYRKEVLFNTFYIFSGIMAALQIPKIVTLVQTRSIVSFSDVSSNGMDQFVLALGLFLTIFKREGKNKYYLGKLEDFIITILLFAAAVISFSRTMIVIFVCLMIPLCFIRFKGVLKVIILALLTIMILFTTLPQAASTFFEKVTNSIHEVSSNEQVWNTVSIVGNWRGYEIYCAKQQFKDSSTFEQLFGEGFGRGVDAKGYAYLVTPEDTVPYLHNGYYTILIKMGIIGVLISISVYGCFMIAAKSRVLAAYEKRLLYGLLLGMIVSSYVIGGMFIGGSSIVFIAFNVWILNANE